MPHIRSIASASADARAAAKAAVPHAIREACSAIAGSMSSPKEIIAAAGWTEAQAMPHIRSIASAALVSADAFMSTEARPS